MLSIQHQQSPGRLTPNMLPCTIHHNGPLKISKRYWNPQRTSSDNTSTSYLRGRKLCGRSVKLPPGYQGYLLQKTDRDAQSPSSRQGAMRLPVDVDEDGLDNELEEDEAEEIKVMQQKASFDEVVVWAHEVPPENGDEYVKGIEEWIAFAEAMHTDHGTRHGENVPAAPARESAESSKTA